MSFLWLLFWIFSVSMVLFFGWYFYTIHRAEKELNPDHQFPRGQNDGIRSGGDGLRWQINILDPKPG